MTPDPSPSSLPPEMVGVIRCALGIAVAENGGELPADMAPRVAAALAPLLAERETKASDYACAALADARHWHERYDVATAEASRLREALEEIRDYQPRGYESESPEGHARRVSTAALSSSPDTEPEQATAVTLAGCTCRAVSGWHASDCALASSSSEEGERAAAREWLLGFEPETQDVAAERGPHLAPGERVWVIEKAALRERLTSDEAVEALAHGLGSGPQRAWRHNATYYRSGLTAVADVLDPRTEEENGRG